MRPAILYDGECPFCTAQAARLGRLVRGRVRLENAYAPGVRAKYPGVPAEGVLGAMLLVDADGRVHAGAAAIARALQIGGGPLGWLAGAYRWPVVRPLADRAYAVVSRRRRRRAPCADAACDPHDAAAPR